jgi:hypothetical protein
VPEFFDKLRQRKLVQWALACLVAAFALIQVLDIVAQRFGWPESIERLVIIALAIGFFIVLVLAWYHGERGAQRVSGTELLILALLLTIGGAVAWRLAPPTTAAPTTRANAISKQPSIADANTPPIEIGFGYQDLGDLQQLNGDHAVAIASYKHASDLMQPLVEREPDNEWAFGVLTYARIGLGEGDAALAAMQQRQSERPEAKGATDNDLIREFRARVLARLGHKPEATTELRYLLGIHYGGLMPPLTSAFLRLDPDFDRLRDDPAFQKLAAGAVAAPAASSGANRDQ